MLIRNGLNFKMTPEMNWTILEIVHVKPICMFDVSKDKEIGEPFSW